MISRKDSTTAPNRVWIEIEPPATHEEGTARAAELHRMLHRLGIRRGTYDLVRWDPSAHMYAFTIDEAGGFVHAEDHGHWYNLSHLGRIDA